MATLLNKENITISTGEYQKDGATKQRWKTIGELITMQGDDGQPYQFFKLWGSGGVVEGKVFDQEDKQQNNQQQQQQAQQAAQDPNLKIAQEAERTKRMEVERKTAKDQAEMQLSMGDQHLRAMKEQAPLQLGKSEQQRKQGKDVVDSEEVLEIWT